MANGLDPAPRVDAAGLHPVIQRRPVGLPSLIQAHGRKGAWLGTDQATWRDEGTAQLHSLGRGKRAMPAPDLAVLVEEAWEFGSE